MLSYRIFGKRTVDLALALPALALSAPFIGLLALLIRWRLGSPVFFRQQRPGLHGRPFSINKLRTMREAVDHTGRPLPDAERLTPLGRFLRRSSLDELPELINVVRGDMSLVGPRPLRMRYLERYSDEQHRRHEVLPGITGWAQVNGRNAIRWEERLELDIWYVDNMSFTLDLRILAMTLWKVLARQDIEAAGHATMPEFMGTRGPEEGEDSGG